MKSALIGSIVFGTLWTQFLWYTENLTTLANWTLSIIGLVIVMLALDLEIALKEALSELQEDEWTEDDVV